MSDLDLKTIEPEKLKALIADKAKIDEERISIRHNEILEVGIAGLTESELYGIRGGLLHTGFQHDAFKVVEDPAPGRTRHYTLETLTQLLLGMAEAPDTQLDKHFAAECGAFAKEGHDLEETLRFIRNMRDKCVFAAGGSTFVMNLWNYMLDEYPETEEAKAERRKELERWAGMA